MPKISDAEIKSYAAQAGFTGAALDKAVAIALAESGGNTTARGDTTLQTSTWGPSIGLWQIRSLNSQRGTGGQRDEVANANPAVNAANAFRLSNGGKNWAPWSTFKSGAYFPYLPRASAAGTGGQNAGLVPGDNSGVSPANPISGLGDTITNALNPLSIFSSLIPNLTFLLDPGTWKRLGAFLLGSVLIVFALYRATDAGTYIRKAVATGVKVAAVVK